MKLLEVPYTPYGTADELTSNIRSAIGRGLPEYAPALCSHDGTFVIVGSGPSLPAHLEEIREQRALGRPILACNGAHDFLCEHGLAPDLFLTVDPRNTIIPNTQKKNAHTVYLLASRCSPELFDHLSDCKVMLWHSWQSPNEANAESAAINGKFAIGGGTTSGTRAIYVGYCMGFRRFIVFGLDSCLADDGHTKRFSGEQITDKHVIEVFVGGPDGKRFLTNTPMAQQASEIQAVMQTIPNATFDFRGPGLIAAIWAERKARNLPV